MILLVTYLYGKGWSVLYSDVPFPFRHPFSGPTNCVRLRVAEVQHFVIELNACEQIKATCIRFNVLQHGVLVREHFRDGTRPWKIRELVKGFWCLQLSVLDGLSPHTSNATLRLEHNGIESFRNTVFAG